MFESAGAAEGDVRRCDGLDRHAQVWRSGFWMQVETAVHLAAQRDSAERGCSELSPQDRGTSD